MLAEIHSTAVVSPTARLEEDVRVGPFAIVEADVVVGRGSHVHAHAVVRTGVRLGQRVEVHPGAVVGGLPQIRDDSTGAGLVDIGDRCCIREHATVHRASAPDGVTRVGRACYLMAGAHVAHDCQLGDGVVLANGALLAGHVQVGADAFVSGNAVIHQHVRLGERSLVRGGAGVGKDVPPFTIVGHVSRLRGLNTVGLRRAAIPPEDRRLLHEAYRLLFRAGLPLDTAVAAVRALPPCPALATLLAFLVPSRRGLARPRARARAQQRQTPVDVAP